MKFMITFTHIEGAWERLDPDELARVRTQHEEFVSALAAEQNTQMTFLSPPVEARVVRRHGDGSLDVSDGPLMPGPEFVGGSFVIEADSMENAVQFAKRGRYMAGANEVREIQEQ